MKLYEIANEYQQAFDAMTDEGLSDEIIADSLAALDASFEEKAISVAAYILNLEAEIMAIDDARERMFIRYSKLVNKRDHIKKYLLTHMNLCNTARIKTPQFMVSIRKNPPKLVIDNNVEFSSEYVEEVITTERVLLKCAIKEALKEGKEVPGAHLEQSERLHFE